MRPSFLVRMGLLSGFLYFLLARPRMLTAGTRSGEAERTFPGDNLIPSPQFQSTRAIDITAPPAKVWAWIAQMGRDGTGLYGPEFFGDPPSTAYLRHDLPAPQPGAAMNGLYRIMAVEPERLLLYGGFDLTLAAPPSETMERTTLLLLEPLPDGKTRLLIRTRGYTYGVFAPIFNTFYELYDFIFSTAQLENIRQRAETLHQLQVSAAN